MPTSVQRAYVIPGNDITTGKRGARELRKQQQVENFPTSTCFKKANLWTSDDNVLGVIRIYFVKNTDGYSIYEYEGTAEQTKTDFQLLIDARDQNQSVGQTYNKVFKNGSYPPATGIA
jgi:hypothetical protein